MRALFSHQLHRHPNIYIEREIFIYTTLTHKTHTPQNATPLFRHVISKNRNGFSFVFLLHGSPSRVHVYVYFRFESHDPYHFLIHFLWTCIKLRVCVNICQQSITKGNRLHAACIMWFAASCYDERKRKGETKQNKIK